MLTDDEGADVNSWVNVIRRARLGRTVKAVAVTLATYADPDGTRVFPGIARLSVDCELTYNVVQAALSALRKAGLIQLVRAAARRGESDEYRLTLAEDVLDRVDVLTPAQVVAQAQAILDRHRGKHRPDPNLHPTAKGAATTEPNDLHPTARGAGQPPAPHGEPHTSTPAPHGIPDLHPTPLATTLQDPPPKSPSTDDNRLRTAVTDPRPRASPPPRPPPPAARRPAADRGHVPRCPYPTTDPATCAVCRSERIQGAA